MKEKVDNCVNAHKYENHQNCLITILKIHDFINNSI